MGKPSLFEQFGFEGATRVALALYDRVMESDRLERYFRGVDMERLVEHQSLFLAFIMGGPASYSDEELKAVHRPLEIEAEAFEEMLSLLRAVLEGEDIPAADVEDVVGKLALRRPSIVVGRTGSGNRVA
jgi:hemoglobin